MTAALAIALAPLDRLRAAFLAHFGAWASRILADRALRVAVYAAMGIASALVVTCAAPLWAFALAPLVLGVPHLVADVRYLVVKPGLHRRIGLAISTGIPILAATIAGEPAYGLASGFGVLLF